MTPDPKRFRVLHVSSSYPLVPGESTAPFMEEMLDALALRGHRVTVIVPRVEGLMEGRRNQVEVVGAPYAPRRLQQWGYGRSLHRSGRVRTIAALETPIALGAMASMLRSTIKNSRFDLVHLHWVLPLGILGAVVPSSMPVILSAHGADARLARGLLAPAASWALGRADAIVAASPSILEQMNSIHPSANRRSVVIPHGARSDLFGTHTTSEARKKLGIRTDRKIVLAVGRLVAKKGFRDLVRSMVHLADSGVELVIVGDGPLRPALEITTSTNRLDERVQLVGSQSRSEVAIWMAAADVIAIPSVRTSGDVDSGPVVLMEALAAGKPVVTTRVGMAPDLIKDGVNGLFMKPEDPEDIARRIVRAMENSISLGANARRTFERVGDWDRVAGDLEEVYRTVS